MTEKITVETWVGAPPDAAWRAYADPDAITQWNFASPDWRCPSAEVDLRVGGRHVARMEAKDGSVGFDFAGAYEEVAAPGAVTLRLDDGRTARTTFEAAGDGTRVRTCFDADPSHDAELQRDGWQAILENYAKHITETST